MEVRIESEEKRVPTRAATMVLEGLTLLREAVAIEDDSDVAELLKRIEVGLEGRASAPAERVLAAAGERFMRGELPILTPDDLLVLDGLMAVVAPANELELESLRAGTVIGVLRGLIRWLAERFGAAVQATTGLLPANRTPNLTGLQGLLPRAGRPRQVAGGLLALGARQLRTGYTLLGATGVRVGDDRHGGSGVPINPLLTGPFGPVDVPRPGANA
jgi:hypothetical protein